jgi:hypothetical protein
LALLDAARALEDGVEMAPGARKVTLVDRETTNAWPVDIKYVAINHFIEVTYNGVIRRLLVASAKGSPVVT